jgi:hypothetical protein
MDAKRGSFEANPSVSNSIPRPRAEFARFRINVTRAVSVLDAKWDANAMERASPMAGNRGWRASFEKAFKSGRAVASVFE